MFTYLLLAAVSALVYQIEIYHTKRLTRAIIAGMIFTGIAVTCLTLTSFSDPGIFKQHSRPKGPHWTYSVQARSFRPPGTIFCKHCKVLVEDYDHFCVASGTVIGKKNIGCFRMFLFFLMIALAYDVVLLVATFASEAF